MHGFAFTTAPVCGLTMRLVDRVILGDTPEGFRLTGFLGEGRADGPRLKGAILKGGADWAYIRPDGVLSAEVKLHLRTDDGALIQIFYEGVVDMGPDAYERVRQGQPLGPVFHPRTAVRMLTHAADYLWVNRRQFIGIGYLDYSHGNGAISYDIHELRTPDN